MASLMQVLRQLQDQRSFAKQQVQRLDGAIAAIEKLVRNSSRSTVSQHKQRGTRTISAATRKKIAAAQKARWAKVSQQKKAA